MHSEVAGNIVIRASKESAPVVVTLDQARCELRLGGLLKIYAFGGLTIPRRYDAAVTRVYECSERSSGHKPLWLSTDAPNYGRFYGNEAF